MRRILTIIFCLLTLAASSSILDNKKTRQMKTAIQTARTAIKNSKDLEKNETAIRNYLKDSLFINNKDLHLVLFELLKKQYEAGNEKMYLNQAIDTASLSRVGKRMFMAAEQLDTIDAKANAKGVSAPSYRKKHSLYLTPYRGNILKGAIYFLSHKQYQDSWELLDIYLSAPGHPLFADVPQDSTHNTFAAFLSVMAACNMNDLAKAEKYSEDALEYLPRREVTLKSLSQLALEKKDTAKYVKYVTEGFRYYPESEYFFPKLIDHYIDKGEIAKALTYTDDALRKDSLNPLFLYSKHNILMYQKDYEGAMKYGRMVLMQNDSLAVPNYNIGYIYYLKAGKAMEDKEKSVRQRMKVAQKYYSKSLPYMEKFRALEPKEEKRWKPILYDIYLNLNMGKEFKAIQKGQN